MADFTILKDINTTLKTIFKDMKIDETNPKLPEDDIVFESPGDIDLQEKPKLSIFLYQITENSYLRNTSPEPVDTANGQQKMKFPPLILDLYFLFTPYAKQKDTELIMLEKIARKLHDNSVIRGERLKGRLNESGNPEIRVEPHSLSIDELNKLWGMFPNKPYRLSVSYILTPVRIPSEKETDFVRVTEKVFGRAQ